MTCTLYNCKTTANGWSFAKFDPDFNIAAIYTVKVEPKQMVCDCPGWPRKSICKHTRMVNTFALAGAINTSQFYCYETQTWHQPIQTEGENDPTAEKAAQVLAELPAGEYKAEVIKDGSDIYIVPAGPTTSPREALRTRLKEGLESGEIRVVKTSPTPLRRRV